MYKMIGIIMAGGRGSRMNFIEKPLINVGDITVLERVVYVLQEAGLDVVIAVSKHTPKTSEKAQMMKLRVVQTPGGGYVRDCRFLLDKLKIGYALVVSSDLPFISSKLIKDVIRDYNTYKKPICVAINEVDYISMGFTPSVTIRVNNQTLVPVGVNIMEINEGEDHIHIIKGLGAININTFNELEHIKCQK